MNTNKMIAFPDYNAPMNNEAQTRFDEKIAKLERDSELYTSYTHDGPDENPLIRRYQENLARDYDGLLEKVLAKQKKESL